MDVKWSTASVKVTEEAKPKFKSNLKRKIEQKKGSCANVLNFQQSISFMSDISYHNPSEQPI